MRKEIRDKTPLLRNNQEILESHLEDSKNAPRSKEINRQKIREQGEIKRKLSALKDNVKKRASENYYTGEILAHIKRI